MSIVWHHWKERGSRIALQDEALRQGGDTKGIETKMRNKVRGKESTLWMENTSKGLVV